MHRFTACALLLPALFTPSLAAHSQSAATATTSERGFPSDSAVLAIIRQRVEEKRSAGIVVGLLEPDGHT